MSDTVRSATTVDPAGHTAPTAPTVTTAPADLRIECCPDCEAPAEIEWSDTVDSTGGPLELVKVRCLNRHWFLMPAAGLHQH